MGNQPFGYFAALGAMHGWSDGDGYYENYLGHPIQGAVSDYLWIHNDLRYRNVEFGKSRDYWMSRLRAYAYSWAFSEQFEIGLFSEASLGQIQKYCCAYGFVDHVVTPNFGMVWLIGGDIIDRYVTRPLENRTRSVTARSVLRSAIILPRALPTFSCCDTRGIARTGPTMTGNSTCGQTRPPLANSCSLSFRNSN
ncbi:MAG: hypothetical protein DMG80_09845 [Acidobacteria bacterium]|nr:MAG: hypothetical protein DMG80_09845 [Acidobacteriota bacterium]